MVEHKLKTETTFQTKQKTTTTDKLNLRQYITRLRQIEGNSQKQISNQ